MQPDFELSLRFRNEVNAQCQNWYPVKMKNGAIILGEDWASHLYGPEVFSYLERGSFPKLPDGKWDYQSRLISNVLKSC